MQKFVRITGGNIEFYLKNYYLILFSLRNSRIKAKRLAILEVYFALSSLNPVFIKNGPLGDVKGVFSFFIEKKKTYNLRNILKKLGYSNKFYLLDFDSDSTENNSDIVSKNELIWKGKRFTINNFHLQDESIYEKQSPHKRKFIILDANNQEKELKGYRGDGSEFARRALPVEDARCLVNLSNYSMAKRLLDPFAGAGGIIYQAKYINNKIDIYSVDIDPVIAPGLRFYGSKHYTADSCDICFEKEFFDAVVTEVPFSSKSTNDILKSIKNLHNSINKNGSFVMMCSKEQALFLEEYVSNLGYYQYVSEEINRKGIDVVIMAWFKSYRKYKEIKDLVDVLENVF